VKFIPFHAKFVQNPTEPHERFRDIQLVARMESDLLDAFFTWILDGAMKWYSSGLVNIPAVMRKETEVYIQENDEIGEFLADKTEPEEGQFIPSSRLYKKYCKWCHTQNSQAKGVKSFSQEMEIKYKKERKRIGQVFVGLRFKTPTDLQEGFVDL
jgi:phage/plasmid-associated DNA primase